MAEEVLSGGLADDLKLEEIAQKHGVPVEDLKLELEKGIEVEKEHTTDEKVAAEIARDHLVENPKYYQDLKKVEQPVEPAKPAEPQQPNIEEIVAAAVAKAMQAMEETKRLEIENEKKKAQEEVLKAKQEAERLKLENDELHRTQPTGIPNLKGQFGEVESTSTEKAHEIAKGYRSGYKGY